MRLTVQTKVLVFIRWSCLLKVQNLVPSVWHLYKGSKYIYIPLLASFMVSVTNEEPAISSGYRVGFVASTHGVAVTAYRGFIGVPTRRNFVALCLCTSRSNTFRGIVASESINWLQGRYNPVALWMVALIILVPFQAELMRLNERKSRVAEYYCCIPSGIIIALYWPKCCCDH